MYKEGKRIPERHKFWSKESFLADLRKIGNIKGVCEIYVLPNKGWRAQYLDVSRWRKKDLKFDKEVSEIISSSETSIPAGPGRERKDNGDLSWQDLYCEALYEFDGNRKLASAATPYSFGQIMDMLNPDTVSYDKTFSEKVKVVEAEIASEIEQMLLELRKPEHFESFEQSKISQTKAWYALKLLEKLDRMRYGRYVEMHMNAKIQHQHTVDLIPKEQRIFNLYEEQRKYLESRRLSLIEGKNPDQKLDIVEAVLVEPGEQSLDTDNS